MEEIEQIFDEAGINGASLEAAVELGRLAALETDVCCEALGKLIWACYNKLEEAEEGE